MKGLVLAATAALALAACTGGEPTAVQTRADTPPRATGGQNVTTYTIFEWWRAPDSLFIPDSTKEYGIRFKSSIPGRVVGFRVYTYGPGEYRLRLRNDAGQSLATGGTLTTWDTTVGWKNVSLSTAPYTLTVGKYYRVTGTSRNGSMGLTPNFFATGPFTHNNVLTATQGAIYLTGPPVQVLVDSTTTAYFVDVIFQPESELE
ncbi:MAG: DUF4082 domain-containing protein [Longimicrobiaceae bacterium]